MPRCSSCGTVATEGTHFCPRCGASMTAPSPDFSPPTAETTAPDAPPTPPPPPPPPYGAPAYGQPYAYAPPRPPQSTNGMAVASLVLGILSLCGIGSILAVIFGYVAKGQIDRSGGTQSGRGMAIAGIVLGWIGIAGIVILIIIGIIGSITDSGSSQQSLALL